MTKENIYDLIKAHATELVDGRFRFKKVDLKEACAELEDCFKRLHKPVVMQGLPDDNIANLYNELSGSPTVGKACGDASVSDGK